MNHLNDILHLSVQEKLQLIEKIWESIDPNSVEVSGSQKEELDRRLEKLRSGNMEFSSWEDVRARVRSQVS